MPLIAMRCSACRDETEHLLSFSDPDPTTCQLCHSDLERAPLDTLNFTLRGSGWGKQ